MKQHHGCPVQATMNTMSGKWKVQILWYLSFGPLRFGELRKKLAKISEKVLAEQLRQLEADRVVERSASQEVPPAVTYYLSEAGKKLVPLMETMCEWGCGHFGMTPNLPRAASRDILHL
jgi:DNA-binding HxlR family transcriptional regulator